MNAIKREHAIRTLANFKSGSRSATETIDAILEAEQERKENEESYPLTFQTKLCGMNTAHNNNEIAELREKIKYLCGLLAKVREIVR